MHGDLMHGQQVPADVSTHFAAQLRRGHGGGLQVQQVREQERVQAGGAVTEEEPRAA